MAAKMNGLLLDTTILIDLSRGNEQAASFIEQQRQMKVYLAQLRCLRWNWLLVAETNVKLVWLNF